MCVSGNTDEKNRVGRSGIYFFFNVYEQIENYENIILYIKEYIVVANIWESRGNVSP
jgi:hypothetical protein